MKLLKNCALDRVLYDALDEAESMGGKLPIIFNYCGEEYGILYGLGSQDCGYYISLVPLSEIDMSINSGHLKLILDTQVEISIDEDYDIDFIGFLVFNTKDESNEFASTFGSGNLNAAFTESSFIDNNNIYINLI